MIEIAYNFIKVTIHVYKLKNIRLLLYELLSTNVYLKSV